MQVDLSGGTGSEYSAFALSSRVLTDGPMGDAILAMFVRTVQTYGCNGFKYNI